MSYNIFERKASFAQIREEDIKSDSGESLYIVTKIMQDIKKYTAREVNKILKR